VRAHSPPTTGRWSWFGLSFDQLAEQNAPARQLLELCAFFGAEPISIQLLPMALRDVAAGRGRRHAARRHPAAPGRSATSPGSGRRRSTRPQQYSVATAGARGTAGAAHRAVAGRLTATLCGKSWPGTPRATRLTTPRRGIGKPRSAQTVRADLRLGRDRVRI
jgi:hypothetical protein